MLASAKTIAFVGTVNPDRARSIYEQTMGLRRIPDEQFAWVFDSNGTMLRVSKLQSLSPLPFTVLGWEVRDIRTTVGSLRRRGLDFLRFEGFAQDDDGLTQFSHGTLDAWFKDPDGNMLSLTQFSEQHNGG